MLTGKINAIVLAVSCCLIPSAAHASCGLPSDGPQAPPPPPMPKTPNRDGTYPGSPDSPYSDPLAPKKAKSETDTWNGPDTVGWNFSIEDARKLAEPAHAALAILFWDQDPASLKEFDAKALAEMKKSGLAAVVRLAAASSAKLLENYDASANALVVCAPNGEKLWMCSGRDCTPASALRYLTGDFKAALAAWQEKNKTPPSAKAVKVGEPRLSNLLRFTSSLYSGPTPAGEPAFQALKDLGIKTIICVDGAPPVTALAERMGMQYIHLPVPYREIPKTRGIEIAKAIRELPGPIYIHCSCGLGRSPAAAGTACVILGQMTSGEAWNALALAGLAREYTGLYGSVLTAVPLSRQTLDALKVEYTAKVPPPPLTRAMVEIQKTWNRVDAVRALEWKTPEGREDLYPKDNLMELVDLFSQIAAMDEIAQSPEKRKILAETQNSLGLALRAWKSKENPAARIENLNSAFTRVAKSCTECHNQFRNK